MKRILISLVLSFFCVLPLMAQKNKVTSAWNYLRYNEYLKARDAINEAVNHEDTKNDPTAWMYRGQAYMGIYNSTNAEVKNAEPDALIEAYKSYVKAAELDKNSKRPEPAIKGELLNVAVALYNQGINAYGAKDFENALRYFEAYNNSAVALGSQRADLDNFLKANKINPLDIQLYIAGAAQSMGDQERAMAAYRSLADLKYDEPLVYSSLANMYKTQGDTAKALAVLDEGLGIVTSKKELLIDKVNIYISANEIQKAIDLGKEAIRLDPSNVDLYAAVGNMYDQLQMPTEAVDMYEKGLKLAPDNVHLNYSYGLHFYNKGAIMYNNSVEAKGIEAQNKFIEEAKKIWQQGVPYLEKAIADPKSPNYREALNILAEVYAKIGDLEKSQMYRDKLKN